MRWIALFVLGGLMFLMAGNRIVAGYLDPAFAGDSMRVRVRILDKATMHGSSISFTVTPVADQRLPPSSRLAWFEPEVQPLPGETWQLEVRLQRPRGYSNPGGFSRENWLFRERIQATGYVVPGRRNQRLAGPVVGPLDEYRNKVVSLARATDPAAAAVFAAVTVGQRQLIDRAAWDRYARTGTSHLVAISGLHIGLAAGTAIPLLMALAAACRLRGNWLSFANAGMIAVATAYAAISGFAIPAQRAMLMLTLLALAFVSRRVPSPVNAIAISAGLIFCVNPISLLAPGFWLSYSAVLLLLYRARSEHARGWWARCLQLVRAQFALLIGLSPLTVLFFQRIALLAPFVNLFVVPLFSFVTVPLALICLALVPLSTDAASVVMKVAAYSIRLVERVIGLFADSPVANTDIAGVDGDDTSLWLILLLPLAALLVPRGIPGRWAGIAGIICLLLYRPAAPPHGCVEASVLDVGHGLAVVLQGAGHVLLYDTAAPLRGGGAVAGQTVVPFLKYRGIRFLDHVVVSHGDADHAGGFQAIADAMRIGAVVSGESLPVAELETTRCRSGHRWSVDGVEYEFLHPEGQEAFDGNDASCVLLVRAGRSRLILTGDIERAAERRLLERAVLPTVDVAVIPHHGSLTSSTPDLVDRLSADMAIASTRHGNRWNFPEEAVVRRWQSSGAKVLDTATSGAISLRLCDGAPVARLREERKRRQRFWHDP